MEAFNIDVENTEWPPRHGSGGTLQKFIDALKTRNVVKEDGGAGVATVATSGDAGVFTPTYGEHGRKLRDILKADTNLIPKKVTVHRGGKSFQAIRYVSPDETEVSEPDSGNPEWHNIPVYDKHLTDYHPEQIWNYLGSERAWTHDWTDKGRNGEFWNKEDRQHAIEYVLHSLFGKKVFDNIEDIKDKNKDVDIRILPPSYDDDTEEDKGFEARIQLKLKSDAFLQASVSKDGVHIWDADDLEAFDDSDGESEQRKLFDCLSQVSTALFNDTDFGTWRSDVGHFRQFIDEKNGKKPEAITVYRDMSPAEHDAWLKGGVIPRKKYFATDRKYAKGQDIDYAKDSQVYAFKVPSDLLVPDGSGGWQLRSNASLDDGEINIKKEFLQKAWKHKHDGYPEHPISVKDHPRYFSSRQEEKAPQKGAGQAYKEIHNFISNPDSQNQEKTLGFLRDVVQPTVTEDEAKKLRPLVDAYRQSKEGEDGHEEAREKLFDGMSNILERDRSGKFASRGEGLHGGPDKVTFQQAKQFVEEHRESWQQVLSTLQDVQKQYGGKIEKRLKNPSSLLMKLDSDQSRLTDITDSAGTRIVLRSEDDAKNAAEALKARFGTITKERNYFAKPRDAYYKAHHLVPVINGKPVEVQISTYPTRIIADLAHESIYKNPGMDAKQKEEAFGRIAKLEGALQALDERSIVLLQNAVYKRKVALEVHDGKFEFKADKVSGKLQKIVKQLEKVVED